MLSLLYSDICYIKSYSTAGQALGVLLLLGDSDATGLNHFNTIKTQDCYQNLLYNMVIYCALSTAS